LYIDREYLPHQQELLAGGFGQTGCRLYVVAANHIKPGSAGLHKHNSQLQTTAATATTHQHSRHSEYARAGG